jgi:hypothetical protein
MPNSLTRGNARVGSLAATRDLSSATLTVGGGTTINKIASGTASVDFPSIAPVSTGSATFTLTGAVTSDIVILNVPALTNGLGFVGASVTAADTVTVYAVNTTASAIHNAAVTCKYLLVDMA